MMKYKNKILGIMDCCAQIPFDINFDSMGGSETWLKEISMQFANSGWHVVIFANVPEVSFYENIELVPLQLTPARCSYQKFDKFIFSRGIIGDHFVKCDDISIMMHDTSLVRVNVINISDTFNRLKSVYVLSDYSKQLFKNQFPNFPDEKIKLTYNGIDYSLYSNIQNKTNSMVWSSCRERGFDYFVQYVLPHVLKFVPDFTTYFCSYNRYNIKNDEKLNIKNLGNINKQELADLQSRSKIWCYPNLGYYYLIDNKNISNIIFKETFCISAIENVAANNIIIAGDLGGLQTTLRDYSLLGKEFYDINGKIPENKYEEYGKYLADYCIRALRGEWKPEQSKLRYTWQGAISTFL